MPDVLTPSQRSFNMSRIGAANTAPEMSVRRIVHGMGYRYRLHQRKLPGCPDLVFASRRKVIFVHGCFWHHHDCRFGQVQPRTHATFWREKIAGNVARDTRNAKMLNALGWSAMVIWECEAGDVTQIRHRVEKFLDG
jgi:DNA mismatch endonuclease (patch repair protein)